MRVVTTLLFAIALIGCASSPQAPKIASEKDDGQKTTKAQADPKFKQYDYFSQLQIDRR